MSYAAIKWSYLSPHVLNAKLSPSELAVLRALCWYYKDQGRTKNDRNCYVGVETLARTIGKSTDTVDRAKARLRKKGLISWDRAANFDAESRKTNNYSIACPELEKLLDANERKLKAAKPRQQLDDAAALEALNNMTFPLQPGMLYFRPDPAEIAKEFPRSVDAARAEWLADALAFAGDSSDNRIALHSAMLRADDLNFCRQALERVVDISRRGRKITNRLGYLLRPLKPRKPGSS